MIPRALAATFAILVIAAPSHAQDATGAEALFAQGRKLMEQKDYEGACKKFEQSQTLDPAVGTLLNLGECYEKTGRDASAWLRYREAASAAHAQSQDAREKLALRRADELAGSLCSVVIGHPNEVGHRELLMKLDGVRLETSVLGVARPIDPGPHTLVFANGQQVSSVPLEIRKPDGGGACSDVVVEIPAWAHASAEPPPEPPSPSNPPAAVIEQRPTIAPPPPKTDVAPMQGGFSIEHGVAIGLWSGAAIVGGVGIGFGVDAISKQSTAEESCTPEGCKPEGRTGLIDAGYSADVATGLLSVGGALVVAGTIVWLVAPSLDVVPTSNGVALRF